jgi:hypothetical protein
MGAKRDFHLGLLFLANLGPGRNLALPIPHGLEPEIRGGNIRANGFTLSPLGQPFRGVPFRLLLPFHNSIFD